VAETLTKDFYSWFPIYFAFQEEEQLAAGEAIVIEVQRQSSPLKVWYQWRYLLKSAEAIRKHSQWHNESGRTAILLSEE
jgi:hypothetical protein